MKNILKRLENSRNKASRKVREVHKVLKNAKMEGGNGATIGSGITQFAEGEPKRWNYPNH